MASPSNATTTVAKSPSRSPLKRSATAPLYGPSHANINLSTASSSSSLSNASSSGKGKTITMTSAGPSASQYKDNCNTAVKSTLPSDGWDKVMQAALCRLSSQHHMSDYNRMKRMTSSGIAISSCSQPMQSSISHPLPSRTSTQNQQSSIWSNNNTSNSSNSNTGVSLSPSTVALPSRTSTTLNGSSISPSQAIDGYTVSIAPCPPGINNPIQDDNHHHHSIHPAHEDALLKAELNPPPAPLLHRTFTEEEGQNPHLHILKSSSTSSSSNSRSSISSVGLSTPALSMDSMPPSPPISSVRGGNGRYNSVLNTPPDNQEETAAMHRVVVAKDDGTTSPIARKKQFDERNDRELSERLLDAMEEEGEATSITSSRAGAGLRSGHATAPQKSTKEKRGVNFETLRRAVHRELGRSSEQQQAQQQPQQAHQQQKVEQQQDKNSAVSGSSGNSVSSHHMMTNSSASTNMSRASTNLTSAHASGMSSSSTSSSSGGIGNTCISALTYASRTSSSTNIPSSSQSPHHQANQQNPTSTSATAVMTVDSENQTLYHLHMNHPGLVGVKTSLTHPMNVSPLIPPELLPLYGQSILHATPTLPENIYATSSSSSSSHNNVQQQRQSPQTANAQANNQQRAISPLGKLTMHDMPPGSNLNNALPRPPSPTKSSSSSSSAMHISRPTTPATHGSDGKSQNNMAEDMREEDEDHLKRPFVIQPSADIYDLTGPDASAALFNLTLPISQQLAMISCGDDNDNNGTSDHQINSSSFRLGNLVLSSCPGKKVRLSDSHLTLLGIPEICRPGTGPSVNSPLVDPRTLSRSAVISLGLNRSPICRDLEMDFKRAMEQADVKCVVCCIDDDELRFLGAAWEEYEKVARKLGLEVIRLPMAEGFAPPSPEVLDAHLSSLITRYTLQGKNCLVHCRGGVGRAGLFACSWMIKLGLLGQVVNINDPDEKTLEYEMKIVEKVIAVIRKRRSAKAIETPQQVQFILQYTHWLACHGRHVTARQILTEAGLVESS